MSPRPSGKGFRWEAAVVPPTILPVSPASGDPLATVFLSRTGCGPPLIAQEVDRVLEQFLELLHEAACLRAVGHTMVHRQRGFYKRGNPDLAGHSNRAPGHGAHRKDGRLRWVDDGDEFVDIEHPQIRNGERAAPEVVGTQLVRARALGQGPGLGRNLFQGFFVGVADDRGMSPSSSATAMPMLTCECISRLPSR